MVELVYRHFVDHEKFPSLRISPDIVTADIACNQPRIGVDIHVHRVTNRWGYVAASTPEKTLIQLQAKLPEKYAVEINERLVPFGKHICTGKLPKCSTCPLLSMCRQVGVTEHR